MNRILRWTRWSAAALAVLVVAGGVFAAGCSGGTSSADKTATAVARGGAATETKPAGTSTAAASATEAPATTAPAATGTPAATGESTVKIGQVAAIGSVLTNPAGFTLYIYKDDVPNSGQSSVPAAITPNWPPLTVTAKAVAPPGLPGQLRTFTRPDGSQQVMYNGMPLYTFVADKNPGEANGQGLLNLWFAATP